jgi:hypothetical protein
MAFIRQLVKNRMDECGYADFVANQSSCGNQKNGFEHFGPPFPCVFLQTGRLVRAGPSFEMSLRGKEMRRRIVWKVTIPSD